MWCKKSLVLLFQISNSIFFSPLVMSNGIKSKVFTIFEYIFSLNF